MSLSNAWSAHDGSLLVSLLTPSARLDDGLAKFNELAERRRTVGALVQRIVTLRDSGLLSDGHLLEDIRTYRAKLSVEQGKAAKARRAAAAAAKPATSAPQLDERESIHAAVRQGAISTADAIQLLAALGKRA